MGTISKLVSLLPKEILPIMLAELPQNQQDFFWKIFQHKPVPDDHIDSAIELIERSFRKNLGSAEAAEQLCQACFSKCIHGKSIVSIQDAPFGKNGGQTCDTDKGPCACGAWH